MVSLIVFALAGVRYFVASKVQSPCDTACVATFVPLMRHVAEPSPVGCSSEVSVDVQLNLISTVAPFITENAREVSLLTIRIREPTSPPPPPPPPENGPRGPTTTSSSAVIYR